MKCANCGAEVRNGARFCVECGYDLRGTGSQQSETQPQRRDYDPTPAVAQTSPVVSEPTPASNPTSTSEPTPVAQQPTNKKRPLPAGLMCAFAIMVILAVIVAPSVMNEIQQTEKTSEPQTTQSADEQSTQSTDKKPTEQVQTKAAKESAKSTVCTISYDGNGATGGSMSATRCNQGEQMTVPTCSYVRDGYEFVHWEADGNTSYNPGDTVEVNSNTELQAVWKAKTFTVQFLGGGANGGTTSDVTARYGEDISLPICGYHRDGYEFDRWESATGVTYYAGDIYSVWDDATFTAQWTAKPSSNDSIIVLDETSIANSTSTADDTDPADKTDTTDNTATASHKNRYELVKKDLSWTEANAECVSKGGHLVTITSQDEMDEVIRMAEEAEVDFVWLGGNTTPSGAGSTGQWVTGEPFSFSAWYEGEPSHFDSDGTPETCIELWRFKSTGEWAWNDERDRPLETEQAAEYMAGRMGCVCEYED